MIECKFENGSRAKLRHATVDSIVLDEEERILLVKRSEKLNEGGKWCLPGGFVDRDESVPEAASRETLEETGWTTKDQQLLMIIDSHDRGADDDRQNITFLFAAKIHQKTGEPDWESDEIKFFPLNELPNLDEVAFDHIKLIESYKRIHAKQITTPILSSTTSVY